jgi:hypothetical protein
MEEEENGDGMQMRLREEMPVGGVVCVELFHHPATCLVASSGFELLPGSM